MKLRLTISLLLALLLPLFANSQSFADKSVLSEGNWYKLGVIEEGVYKLDYQFFVENGIDVSLLNPQKISIYGNRSGMLPQRNDLPRPDDLTELAVMFQGDTDSVFNPEDYLLFYGEGPVNWTFSQDDLWYSYSRNSYSDTVYYFLRLDNQNDGKRMMNVSNNNMHVADTIISFLDFQCHEIDVNNPYSFGTKWYGEVLSNATNSSLEFPFYFKNAITDSSAFCYFSMIARSLVETVRCNVTIDNETAGQTITIAKLPGTSNLFASETYRTYQFNAKSDTVLMKVSLDAQENQTMAAVDYISMQVWRELRYANEPLWFSVNSKMNKVSKLKILDAENGLLFWDISSSLDVKKCNYSFDDNLNMPIELDSLHRFVLFDVAQTQKVKSARKIENQNLHAMSPFVDYIIITLPQFREQAEEVATIHEVYDDMTCAVVEVSDIYNEFSTGAVDISAIRNFLQMIYQKGNQRLQYLLLFGDTSFDFRNILGFGTDFVPSFQSDMTYHFARSYVYDDYFAMLTQGEGFTAAGIPDIGVGRFPVTTVQQAVDVLNKLKTYISQSTDVCGEWKNNFLFVSDDDKIDYVNACEALETIIDTTFPTFNISKIYTDSYVRQSVAGGYAYPDAHNELLSSINKGVSFITYFGHGGVKGLTEENLFNLNDITNLTNSSKLSFYYTATCEFTKFDNPAIVSAGERLFLNPNGGAIAMFTTSRPTYTSTNLILANRFFGCMKSNELNRFERFGDIVRETKKSIYDAKYCYVFLGDPALRLNYPNRKVEIQLINGIESDSCQNISTQSSMLVQGAVSTFDNITDTLFNGLLRVKIFDKKIVNSTLSNNNEVQSLDYKEYKDVLFEGKVSVKNGRFDFALDLPDASNFAEGKPKISLYAVDTIRFVDAVGAFFNFNIVQNSQLSTDEQGPDIKMKWNFTELTEGDLCADEGELYVELFDEQGIYHYNNVIGRDLILTHCYANTTSTEVLNDYYEQSQTDDFKHGKLSLKFNSLQSGEHKFCIRAFDNHGNSSEAELVVVVNHTDFEIVSVMNIPNPFTESTVFVVNHNLRSTYLSIKIEVFDMMGRLVYKDDKVSRLNESKTAVMEWNGNDQSGNLLKSGVYVAKLTLIDDEGRKHNGCKQIVIIR